MRWSLRKKILLGNGLVLLLLVLLLGWSLRAMQRLAQASRAILEENYRSIIAAESMVNALERQDSAALMMLLGARREGLVLARDQEAEFLQWLGRARDNITIKGELEVVESVGSGYRAYLAAVTTGTSADDTAEPLRVYWEQIYPAFKKVRDDCLRLRDLNQEVMLAAGQRAERTAQWGIWSQTAVGLAAVVLGLIFSLLLATWVTRPVRQTMEGLQNIAAGDWDVEVAATANDELGRMAAEFNEMTRQLRRYRDMNLEHTLAEQRKSATILRSIEDGLLVVDAALQVTDINPKAADLLAVEVDRAVGRHLLEVVRDDSLFAAVKAAVEGQSPADDEERLLSVPGDDGPRRYEYDVTPVAAPGLGAAVVVLFRDVTRLKELDELKTKFVMTASHELRTPLTSIGMAVSLVREKSAGLLSERERELLAAAESDVARLKSLIGDLLDLSRLESGQVMMDLDRVSLALLIESATGILAPQAADKGVALTVTVDQPDPRVIADANKITWVLTNLLANALRFTPSGGRITVTTRRLAQQVQVTVTDDGAGIPHEAQSRIFDKFVQVEGRAGSGGTGLGLAICKEIVRAHGGTIWVESVPGEGSQFTFCLPLSEPDEGEAHDPAAGGDR